MTEPSFAEFVGITLHPREKKPRRNGISMVIDTGYSVPFVAGVLEQFGHLIDVVKITELHLTAPVDVIREKVRRYKDAGVKVQPGGIVIELARLQKNELNVLKKLNDIGFDSIEVSSSSTSQRERDAERDFVRDVQKSGFRVYGEVGKKFAEGDKTRRSDTELDVDETIAQIRALLDGGAEKVYWEGHVLRRIMGDTAGDILDRHPAATQQVKAVVDVIGQDNLIFEVSSMIPYIHRRAQQFWMVRTFGPNVNVGNVRLEELQFLEHIRLGTWPVFGFGPIGDHPYMQSLEKNDGKASETWWQDIPIGK
jgi:phosphosulfolactate synthase